MSHTQEPITQEPASKAQDDGRTSQTAVSKPPENEPLNREIISAAAAKPDGDIKVREDIEKLRRDYHELREKLNTVRENDILPLKEKTTSLFLRLTGAALIGTILSVFGVKFYFFDLNKMVEDRIKDRAEKAIDYNEKFITATTLAGLQDYQNSIPILDELYAQKPENETVFYKLLDSLNQVERYRDAIPYIERARKNGLLSDKYKNFFSFNNAGYLVLIASTEDPSLRPQAYELLQQAVLFGKRNGEDGIDLPLMNLVLYHTMNGEPAEARKYGLKVRLIKGDNWEWTPWPGALLKRLERVRPDIVREMKEALSIGQR